VRTTTAKGYVGRFAPSPTGAIHLGTLVAAVASFLHARQHQGEWLVRIEDIDPPREVEGSADSILKTLDSLGLEWDREIRCQSARLRLYRDIAIDLVARQAAYYCACSRQQIRELTGGTRYPGTCRSLGLGPGDRAIRLRVDEAVERFDDGLMGPIEYDIAATDGDFVIFRRDGLPAYHLAVVVDDADQGITDIVRGRDLLESTPLHRCLQRKLGLPSPRYWHVPLVTDDSGEKLSKRSGAATVDAMEPEAAASSALAHLGMTLPMELAGAPPRELWGYALEHWHIEALAVAGVGPARQ